VRDVHQGGVEVPKHRLQPKNFSSSSNAHRWAAIQPHVTGRSVLDLGCATGHWRDEWMHARIAKVATELVGVDVDAEMCAAVRAKGFDIVQGDAEDFDLGRTFDVVVAGELIEHLGNVGGMITSVKRHLAPGGSFVLTTPNPFASSNFVYRLGRSPVRINKDHTCWFCEDTLRQLFDRYDLDVEVRYLPHDTPGRVRAAAAKLSRIGLPDRLKWNQLFAVARARA
jgi:SAM-dependent methyltransferase